MRKIAFYILIGLVLIFLIFRIGNWTGYLQNFRVYSTENEPTLHEQDWIFGTNLIEPRRLNFISYKVKEEKTDPYLKTHRLIGLPDDTLEIRNGVVFINGKNIDKQLNLKQTYIASYEQINILKNKIKNLKVDRNKIVGLDSLIVNLSDKEVKKTFKPEMPIFDKPDKTIEEIYQKPWSQDQFGPLIIPENKYFAIGDNRDVSYDSRYLGMIDKSDITAVLFVE
ncbi:signal peptidase I [Gillisia sp. Hel1_33_143]|uniref:signal peptidase I n=1 Tax=Gillisia sp. Hel1_33_143 TaxID=1336796 RepID=UPI00087CD300|nr:signal peptidase I [Gillisia sp. Hel1_33_143]SDS65290.1 signal peptidase I [Gillisia sp. Hel1_33_143]